MSLPSEISDGGREGQMDLTPLAYAGDRLAIGDMQCQMRDAATNDNEWRHAA